MFTYFAQLRFSDIDGLGHVNNARFLSYLEDARVNFFTTRAPALTEGGVILARLEIDYLRPILLGSDPLAVTVAVAGVGRSSVRLVHEIRQTGVTAARATAVIVAYDYTAGRSRPLTEQERALLERDRDDTDA